MNECIEEGLSLELRREPPSLLPTLDARGEMTFALRSPGDRYFLGGVPVHAGDLLEMLLDDSSAWKIVRYEHRWDPTAKSLTVVLHLDSDHCMELPEGARFRWPGKPGREEM